MPELLLGCGASRSRRLGIDGRKGWTELVTLDHNPDHKPDVLHDLEVLPYPFDDSTFDEIHAYEVLEHLGSLGDWRSFFAQFSELWRILKPDGFLAATCPSYRGLWAFGDPSHRRVINNGTLTFLDQARYLECGTVDENGSESPRSDFRHWYKADFVTAWVDLHNEASGKFFAFVLKAVKPSRHSLLTTERDALQSVVT